MRKQKKYKKITIVDSMPYDEDLSSYGISDCCKEIGLSYNALIKRLGRIKGSAQPTFMKYATIKRYVESLNITMSAKLFDYFLSLCYSMPISSKKLITLQNDITVIGQCGNIQKRAKRKALLYVGYSTPCFNKKPQKLGKFTAYRKTYDKERNDDD